MTRLIAFLRELLDFLGIVGQQALNVLWWDRITEHHTKIREQGYHEGFQSGFWHGEQEAKDSALAEAGEPDYTKIGPNEQQAIQWATMHIREKLCKAMGIAWIGGEEQSLDILMDLIVLLAHKSEKEPAP